MKLDAAVHFISLSFLRRLKISNKIISPYFFFMFSLNQFLMHHDHHHYPIGIFEKDFCFALITTH